MKTLTLNKKNLLSLFLLLGIVFSVVQIGRSATLNPGHPWTEIGDSPSDVLSVARGGTGTSTLANNNVIIGNDAGAVTLVAPGTSGNVLASNGTSWISSTAPSALTGAVFLLYADESNSTVQTANGPTTHKFWVLPIATSTYSYYMVEAIVNGNQASNGNHADVFNWNISESTNLKETFQWRTWDVTTSGVRNNSHKFIGTIKSVIPASALPPSANFRINGEKNNANTRVTLMVHSFKVYGIK